MSEKKYSEEASAMKENDKEKAEKSIIVDRKQESKITICPLFNSSLSLDPDNHSNSLHY